MINDELKKRIISSLIILPLISFFLYSGYFYFLFIFLVLLLISFYEWNKMAKKTEIKLLGIFFLIFSFYSFYVISKTNYLFFVLFICVSTDIGGYIFGKFFKGPKFTKISPNKTYSGIIGSYFFSLVFLSIFTYATNISLSIQLITITILISTISQIGDIIVSYFKRSSKIKDTGKIIPGHGGLLDRIDGMIFAFPFFYLVILKNNFLL